MPFRLLEPLKVFQLLSTNNKPNIPLNKSLTVPDHMETVAVMVELCKIHSLSLSTEVSIHKMPILMLEEYKHVNHHQDYSKSKAQEEETHVPVWILLSNVNPFQLQLMDKTWSITEEVFSITVELNYQLQLFLLELLTAFTL
eukprot:TRINITY_DN4490_c0_g1_i1.p1 TRINITY_DN4490_c0_g1~~TRINITY_DN4490_c0_g1_i1.p1  ORF type:complete len:142 (-),score=11.55 TRINITY_DN4490_c0_g1_i1:141-566(-)